MSAESVQLNIDVKAKYDDVKNLNKELDKMKDKKIEISANGLDKINKDLAGMQSNLSKLQGKNISLSTNLDTEIAKVKGWVAKREVKQVVIDSDSKKLDDTIARLAQQKEFKLSPYLDPKRLADVNKSIATLENRKFNLEAKLNLSKNQFDEMDRLIAKSQGKQITIKSNLELNKESIAKTEAEIAKISKESAVIKAKLDFDNTSLGKIKNSLSALKDVDFTSSMANGAKNLSGQLNTLAGHADNLATKFGRVATIGSTLVGVGIGKFVHSAVNEFSDYNEQLNRFKAVTGDVNLDQGLIKDLNKLNETLGYSKKELFQNGAQFYSMASAIDLPKEKMDEMTKGLVQMSRDAGSFANLSEEEIAPAMQSIFSGETETMAKRLGIDMRVAAMEAYALSKGVGKSWEEMSQAEKVALRYEYVVDRFKKMNITGDWERTLQTSLPNQLKFLQSKWNDLQLKMGEPLAQAIFPLVKALGSLVDKMNQIPKEDWDKLIDSFVHTAPMAIGSIMGLVGAIQLIGPALKTASAVSGTWGNITKGVDEFTTKMDNARKTTTGAFKEIGEKVVNFSFKKPSYEIDELTGKFLRIDGKRIAKQLAPEEEVTPRLDRIKNALKFPMLENTKNKLNDTFDLPVLKQTKWGVEKAFGGAKNSIAPLLGTMGGLSGAFLGLTAVMTVATIAFGLFTQAGDTPFGGPITDFFNNIGATVSNGVDQAKTFLNGLADALSKIDVSKTMDAMGSAFGKIDFSGVLTSLGNVLGQVGRIFKEVFEKINWAEVVDTLMSGLSTALTTGIKIAEVLINLVLDMDWDAIWKSLFEGLRGAISNVLSALSEVDWVGMLTKLGDILGSGLSTLFVEGMKLILDPSTWSNLFETLGGILLGLLGGLGAMVMTFFTNLFGSDLGKQIGDAFNNLGKTIGDAFNAVGAFFSAGWNYVKNIFIAWLGKIMIPVLSTFDAIQGAVGEAFKWIGDRFNDIKNKIGDTFNGIKDIMSNVGSSISGFFSNAIDTVVSSVKGVINGFLKVLNKPIGALKNLNLMGWKPFEWLSTIPLMANGGIVDSPQMSIIGEAGAEAVVPMERGKSIERLGNLIVDSMKGNSPTQTMSGTGKVVNINVGGFNITESQNASITAQEVVRLIERVAYNT